MSEQAGQLLLPLPAMARFGREDFLAGPANATALAHIERWPHWHMPLAILAGPAGSGKSHLAAIFAQIAGALVLRGDALRRDDVPRLAQRQAIVLEDCDRFLPDEAALFHLINLMRESGIALVLSARTAPDAWGIRTPDLLSRLRLAPLLTLDQPDDGLLGALLVKLFADRQVLVEANVATYALARIERSYAAVNALVAALDRHSLLRKKPISRGMVAEALGEHPDEVEA